MKEKEIIFSFLSEKEITELDSIEYIYNLLSSTVSGRKQYHHKANPSIIYAKNGKQSRIWSRDREVHM